MSEKYVSAGIGLAILFLVLQVAGALLTGTTLSNWNTGVEAASGFVGVALVILIYKFVTHIK